MTEKYGFIYIWRDKKRKRYYIGCHWGHEDDGYICSSKWMRNSYQYRPQDFKRRIIKKIYTDKKDMFLEEQRYLDMIKGDELGKRYYNLNKNWKHWILTGTRKEFRHSEESKLKMSISKKGKKLSDEHRKKISQTLKGKPLNYCRSEETRKKISENNKRLWKDNKIGIKGKKHRAETIEKMKISQKENKSWLGKKHTSEAIEKIKTASLGRKLSEEHRKKISEARKKAVGIPRSEETKRKLRETNKGKPWSEARRNAQKRKYS